MSTKSQDLCQAFTTPSAISIDDLIEKKLREFLYSCPNTEISQNQEKYQENFYTTEILSTGITQEEYFERFFSNVVSGTIKNHSPRYIGHMASSLPNFVHNVSRILTAINPNLVTVERSGAFTMLERQVIGMLHRLFFDRDDNFYSTHAFNSESTLGMIVSGGTLANIAALWCARNNLLGQKGDFPGVEEAGLLSALRFYGYEDAVIIGSSLCHYSFKKAAGLLGIGANSLIQIPANEKSQFDPNLLKELLIDCQKGRRAVLAIIGIAGTTETGGVDRLPEIAEIAQKFGVHFHVDAAWGGPAIFSQKHKRKLAGIEYADTITIDGHKQLYLPMGIGIVLMREPKLANVIEHSAPYIIRTDSHDIGRRSLEGSRPGMCLFLHAGLNIMGREGYEILMDEGIAKIQYLKAQINNLPEFELLAEPMLNILVYRYIPSFFRQQLLEGKLTHSDNLQINQVNEYLQDIKHSLGEGFVSRTTLRNTVYGFNTPISALRVVIANPLTTEADIDIVLDQSKEIGKQIGLRGQQRS
jgi:glutamate decarboxylase